MFGNVYGTWRVVGLTEGIVSPHSQEIKANQATWRKPVQQGRTTLHRLYPDYGAWKFKQYNRNKYYRCVCIKCGFPRKIRDDKLKSRPPKCSACKAKEK